MLTLAADMSEAPPILQRVVSVAYTAVSFLLVLLLLPLVLPLMLVFKTYRKVLAYIIRTCNGDRVLLASGNDSVWLQDSPENRAIINALILLKGNPDVGKLGRIVTERLVDARDPENPRVKLFPKVTKFPTKILHRFVWQEDESFDMKNHVVLHPEPAPSDKAGLERLVGELCSRPLAPHRPAWQFVLLSPGPEDPQHGQIYYGVFRAHHSIADGISLIRTLIQNLVDERKDTVGISHRGAKRTCAQIILRAILEGPAMILSHLCHPADNNIIHGPELSGTKLFSWSEPVDLRLIKQIGAQTGSTVNDVIISCVASTFRDYFRLRTSPIPKEILAYIPVDIRPASATVTLDNQFALVFLDLPLDEDDQLKLLRKTKCRMDKIKRSPEPLVNAFTLEYFMNRLPSWATHLFFDWLSSKSTLVVSNVPGPQEMLTLGGHEIESIVFWPPQKNNVGLSASVFSYCDTIRVGVSVDKSIISNPRPLVDGFLGNIRRLNEAVLSRTVAHGGLDRPD